MSMLHIAGNSSSSSITNIDEPCISPNAVDLRVQKIFRLEPTLFVIDEEQKIHREKKECVVQEDGYWTLNPGTYEVLFDHNIKVGEGEAGWVITRSTLNRNGVFITSGLYDSGYDGPMMGALHVNGGPMSIKPGTRIGQYLSFRAQNLHLYSGSYGFDEQGNPRSEQKILENAIV